MTSKPKRVCACEGHTLDRLLQPTVMALLAESPMHGYALGERLRELPLMKGSKPDASGLYRLLDMLEKQGVVTHRLTDSEVGPAKRIYELTTAGKKCLTKWGNTLENYQQDIAKLVEMMRNTAVRVPA